MIHLKMPTRQEFGNRKARWLILRHDVLQTAPATL